MVGDLHKLPEVVTVREQGGSRLVCLLPGNQIQQSPLGFSHSKEGSSSTSGSPVVFEELEYHEPVCRQHYTQDFRFCWRQNERCFSAYLYCTMSNDSLWDCFLSLGYQWGWLWPWFLQNALCCHGSEQAVLGSPQFVGLAWWNSSNSKVRIKTKFGFNVIYIVIYLITNLMFLV